MRVLLVSLSVGFATLFSGCAGLASYSSGQVGCPSKEIVISDDKRGWSNRTWTAECRGKRFFCEGHQSGEGGSQVTCTPEATSGSEAPVAAAPPAAAAGCQYDTQCKGDRVCVGGECVTP